MRGSDNDARPRDQLIEAVRKEGGRLRYLDRQREHEHTDHTQREEEGQRQSQPERHRRGEAEVLQVVIAGMRPERLPFVAHGAEMPAGGSGLGYALGFMAATALLHAAGIGTAMGVARLVGTYGKPIAQVAGGLFALGGVGVLAGWL